MLPLSRGGAGDKEGSHPEVTHNCGDALQLSLRKFKKGRNGTMQPIISYLRVSTGKQGKSGLGIVAQREAIARFTIEGLEVLSEFVEVETGKGSEALDRRPKLAEALAKAKAKAPGGGGQAVPFVSRRSFHFWADGSTSAVHSHRAGCGRRSVHAAHLRRRHLCPCVPRGHHKRTTPARGELVVPDAQGGIRNQRPFKLALPAVTRRRFSFVGVLPCPFETASSLPHFVVAEPHYRAAAEARQGRRCKYARCKE